VFITGVPDEQLAQFLGAHPDERVAAGLDHLAMDLHDKGRGDGRTADTHQLARLYAHL